MEVSIQEEILYRGWQDNLKILPVTDDLLKISDLIDFDTSKIISLPDSLNRVRKMAAQFLNSFYQIQDVPFELFYKIAFWDFSFEDEISPFRLPIKRKKDESPFYGLLGETLCRKDNNITIKYRHIELPKKITSVTTFSYIHEITHTQLNHLNGCIKSYYHVEILSIFNELLYGYTKGEKYLDTINAIRLNDIKEAIVLLMTDESDYNNLLEACCYIVSTIIAYELFIKYYYSSISLRKEILFNIQRVFNGEITLQQLLDILDANYEDSLNPKRLEKFLKR